MWDTALTPMQATTDAGDVSAVHLAICCSTVSSTSATAIALNWQER